MEENPVRVQMIKKNLVSCATSCELLVTMVRSKSCQQKDLQLELQYKRQKHIN